MSSRPQVDLSFLSLKPADLNAFLAPYTNTIKTDKLVTSDIIEYSFYSAKDQLPEEAVDDPDVRGAFVFKPFSVAEQNTTKAVLSMLESSTGLRFSEVTAGHGELRFGKYNMKAGFAGYTYNPGDFEAGYTPLFINTTLEGQTRAFTQTFLHELGHALNFKHPGLYDTGDSSPVLPVSLDTSLMTVMSYSDYEYNVSYSPLDLKAYLELYGANPSPTAMQYVFTAQGKDATQSVQGQTYQINMVDKDIFWLVDGPHTYDFSRTTQDGRGLYVDAALGAVRWSAPEDWLSINVWQRGGTNEIETMARIADSANVRFFYPGSIAASGASRLALTEPDAMTSDPSSRLILSEHDDVIIMLENESVFNFIDTGEGSDRFIGFIDGVVIDGGEGVDEIQLFGLRSDHRVVRTETGFDITDPNGQSLSIEAVDRVHFDDISVAFDDAGAAGEIYRAFGALGRAPDSPGLGFWLQAMDNGLTRPALVQAVVQSDEFATLYSGTDNPAFLRKLYLNALQRDIDPTGESFWLERLDQGASRASVVEAVVESPESVALHASVAASGLAFYEWEWLSQM